MKKLFRNIFNRKMQIATLIAILVLPLFYGGLYLWAFWDPYNKIDKIPVAVVNMDIGDNEENLGKDLVEELKKDMTMNWDFVSQDEAQKGLDERKYYTQVIIPSDFSKKIINADKADAVSTYIEYKNREATNFMAAKFSSAAMIKIQSKLNQEITKRYFDEVFKESLKSANNLKEAIDGAKKIEDGAHDLATGSAKLVTEMNKAYDGANTLNDGLNKSYSGVEKLKSGADSLGNAYLGIDTLMGVMNQYLADNHDATMSAYMAKLGGAITQTKGGNSQLQSGLNDLLIANGKLKDGAGSLRVGIGELRDGNQKVTDGLVEVEDGANEMGTKLKDKRVEALNKLNSKKTDILSDPVELKNDSVAVVDNNGTAFAPYFIPLSLWVGAMAIYFLVNVFEKTRIKILIILIIGLLQSSVLNFVLMRYVGLQVKSIPLLFAFSIILAWVFDLIQFLLNYFLKEAGKFIAIILLMLQLTSSAGTYPLETLPSQLQKVNPYLPMTYAVGAYREIISGGNMSVVNLDLYLLIKVFILLISFCLLLTVDFKKFKIKKRKYGKNKQKKQNIAISS